MQIAIVHNNQVVKIGEYKELFPHVSFTSNGPADWWLAENSALKVSVFKEYDYDTQKLVSCDPYVENGWVYTVTVESLTQEEIDAAVASKASKIRTRRNQLLKDSDWTQISDSTADKEQWATYRQALRDVTNQAGFPNTIDWPAVPGSGV